MKHTIIFGRLIPVIILAILITSSAFALPLVRKSAQPLGPALDGTVFQFWNDLGGSYHADGSSYASGYRAIHWDEIPDNVANNAIPTDFYNTTVPRGMVLSSARSYDDFFVSSGDNSPVPHYFGDINPNYATDFHSYKGARLFSASPGSCNNIDVYFYIPGTKIPATVNGFGIMFTDVDVSPSAGIICYGVDGKPLGPKENALVSNNGLSFLGVSYPGGERIARVRIFSGTGTLGEPDKSRGGQFDVVVMDSLTYGEPHAIGQHPADFDGDGTSDLSVFRPSNGNWYTLQSGTNTVAQAQFGMAGDVPVDGDYDGDGRNDLAIFRPVTGAWYVLRSADGMVQVKPFGLNGDKPVGGDYDKDGKTDIALWRPSDGNFYSINSSDGQVKINHFGLNGDVPIGTAAP